MRFAPAPSLLFLTLLAFCAAPLSSQTPTPPAAPSLEWVLETARLGQAELARRKPAEALDLYGRALDTAAALRDTLASAALYDLIGEVHEGSGRYQHALTMYERGLETLRSGPSGGGAEIIAEAQNLLRTRGKGVAGQTGPPIGTDLYRGEIPDVANLLGRSGAREELAAILLVNAGNMYLEQRQFTQAELLYRQALVAAKGPPGTAATQRIQSNLAWSAIKDRRFEEADRWLKEALETAPASSVAVASRRGYLALGVSFREQGQYEKAFPNLKRAIELYRLAVDDDKGLVRALAHLATAYLEAGRFEEARDQYLEALRKNETVGDVETHWHAAGGLARSYQLLNRLTDALKYYEACLDAVQRVGNDFLTDQGKMSFLESQDQIFEYYIATALGVAGETHRDTIARAAIERVRDKALETLLISRSAPKRQKPGCLTASYVLPHQGRSPLSAEQWSPLMNSTPNQMAPGVSLRPADETACSEQDEALRTAPSVPPAATFLEYYVLADRTAIAVKSDDRVFVTTAPIGGEKLDSLVNEYLGSVGIEGRRGVSVTRDLISIETAAPSARAEPDIARELYRLLVLPVREQLAATSPERSVVIVPHRSLWRVPFAALRDGDGRYLSDAFRLTYAASEPSWLLTAQRPRTADHRAARAWIVGNPTMPPPATVCGMNLAFKPLRGAQREAGDLAALFGPARSELFRGPQADRLRLEAWQSDFTVVHLATHGVACADEPLDSFVVLAKLDAAATSVDRTSEKVIVRADPRFPVWLPGILRFASPYSRSHSTGIEYPGFLTARTIITNVTLRTDLVTLSACQTGLGRALGQGTIGFTRAFLAAGARSLLVSLWSVDDDSTRELMVAFYEEYLRHGNKALALQRAMKSTRERHPEPRYWAPFTLVGLAE